MAENLSSAAVVIGALRVQGYVCFKQLLFNETLANTMETCDRTETYVVNVQWHTQSGVQGFEPPLSPPPNPVFKYPMEMKSFGLNGR